MCRESDRRAGETVLDATLDDNATARDFASLLPLTLQMDDLLQREKYGHLPRSPTAGGKPQFSYEIGNIVYWSPGPGIVILG
ncbi:cyclophilin-like fold protein [Streptomyces sp. NPDC050546]|uniref:cyclophilin-like fold protein n=1 Tax=Streptomyces sp. NPDC050546 TaxID=3365628 RepID=UPI00379F4282